MQEYLKSRLLQEWLETPMKNLVVRAVNHSSNNSKAETTHLHLKKERNGMTIEATMLKCNKLQSKTTTRKITISFSRQRQAG